MIYNEFEKIPFRFSHRSHPKLRQIYAVLYYLQQGSSFNESISKASKYFHQIHDKYQTIESKLRRNFAGTKDTFFEWYKAGKILMKLKELLKLPEHDIKIFADLLKVNDIEISSNGIKANEGNSRILIKKDLNEKEVFRKYGSGGEGFDHKQLKDWIASNPNSIGLTNVRMTKVEHSFLSGDIVDILFEQTTNTDIVVEIETINPLPGCHQAIKYRALRCAEKGLSLSSDKVRAVIVAWQIPNKVIEFCKKYNIRYFEKRI